MRLRLRLIVAFFLLSVVPLGAVTVFSYRSSANALRTAAAREADVLAGELGERMQVLTAELGQRVENLMEAQQQAEAAPQPAARTAPQAKPAPPAPAAPAATTSPPPSPAPAVDRASEQVAQALGEAAILLKNIELRGLGVPGGSGRGSRPPPRRDETGTTIQGVVPLRPPRGGTREPPLTRTPPPERPPRPAPGFPDAPLPGTGARGAPPAGTAPQAAASGTAELSARLKVDLQAMRREMIRQLVPDGKFETLTPEERQRLFREVNARILGVVQGIQLSAAELQKKAEEARQAAESQGRTTPEVPDVVPGPAPKPSAPPPAPPAVAAVKSVPTPAPATPAVKKTRAISGSHLNVIVESGGKVVRHANAEIDVPNLLDAVFSSTHRDRGEVPFAVAEDGHIYTPTDEDRRKVEALGAPARPDAKPGTTALGDWVVVTTADPSGSGLKLGIARPVGDLMSDLRRAAYRNAGFGVLFIAIALVGIVPLSARLTRNLSKLSEGVGRIAHGDYRARVRVRSNDEVGALAAAFNQMAAEVERHERAAVEQERIKRELELGRQIQNDMLPRAPLRLGHTEVKGVSVPASEVGGDFFNYFPLSHGRIALIVGDVSGKGVGAALLMASIQGSLRTRLALGQDLSAVADEIDRDIEANSPGPVYATLFVGILDPASRVLRFVNAGHHPQYVLRATGGLDRMVSTGLPVGLLSGKGFVEQQLHLSAGDLLFFYTDGCVETESESGEIFGAERLEALLVSTGARSTDEALARVENAVRSFRGAREAFDDATMMAVTVG